MPRAELRQWEYLRRRQLDGFKFRRQLPVGPYIVDFVCLSERLVIEVDGPSHDLRLDYDARRTATLNRRQLPGWSRMSSPLRPAWPATSPLAGRTVRR